MFARSIALMVLSLSVAIAGCGNAGGGGGGGGSTDNDDSGGSNNNGNDSDGDGQNNTGGGSNNNGNDSDGDGQDNTGDGSDGGDGNPDAEPNSVDDALNAMGVDTSFEPRQDSDGEELDEDFTPLGASSDVAQTMEVFLAGLQLQITDPAGSEETLENRAGFIELADDNTGVVSLGITELFDPGQVWEEDRSSFHPGLGGSASGAQSIRAVAAGDVDGDGRDEVVIVYVQADAPALADQIQLDILDDEEGAGASDLTGAMILQQAGVRDLEVATGDFDGDGVDEIAVGYCTDAAAQLAIVGRTAAGGYSPDGWFTTTFDPSLADAEWSLELGSGNIDRDNGEELVVVLNEYDASASDGVSSYWIYDDASNDFVTLTSRQPVIGFDNGVHTALTADVALGDIDADGKDEIILAGLTEFHNDGCQSYGHIHIALDDARAQTNALAQINARFVRDTYVESGTGCNSNSHVIRVRKMHVNMLDVDGDGFPEIQANRRIFRWSPESPWEEAFLLPYDEFLQETRTVGGVFSDATTQMVTGDVTGDGRDDVISFVQWRSEISVWGLLGPNLETAEWTQQLSIPTAFYNGQSRVFPIIVPGNFDKDGLALKYSEGEHYFVFTEPILIAALAAAPCAEGIGQNTGACVTAFGQAEGQEGGIDGTVTVSASTFVSVEARDPFFGIGTGASERVTASASFSAGQFYSLEETVEFTTGPLEDTVVFTTVPLDQYVYTVVSHPDESMVGERIVINVPRSPITLQVEREFYNRSVAEGSFQVGSNVFLHTAGDLDSYPTEGDADALIDTGGLGHLGPLGELVDAAGEALGPIAERLLGNGLKTSRTTTAGQGTGQTSTEIRFSEQTTYRAGAEIAYETEFDVSAGGVKVGGSIGGSVGAGISWGTSSSTIYRGTVGSIDAENFAENVYNFGLFTYLYNYGDPTQQQFEVINYWVER